MSNLSQKIKERLSYYIESGQLSNIEIVDICKHGLDYLNLQKVKKYSEENHISRQGAYMYRNVIDLYGTKFIIDNK